MTLTSHNPKITTVGEATRGWTVKNSLFFQWWYSEAHKLNQDNIFPMIDNRGGHECDIELPVLRLELLPPKTTHKYQTLYLGLTGQSKIRYRSILLQKIVDNTNAWNSNEHNFSSTSNFGKSSLRNGHLPHIGDAMEFFNETWGKNKSSTIMKCWIKSNCLYGKSG